MNKTAITELICLTTMVICWMWFSAIFLFRRKQPATVDKKRDTSSFWGLLFQGLGFGITFSFRRRWFSGVVHDGVTAEIVAIAAAFLCIASVLLARNAVKVLGKEWSLTARVLEGHRLATTGAYRITRNPIYTSMLGMLISTGLLISRWESFAAGLVVFLIGTIIRIRREEALLAEAFGSEFSRYKASIPSLVPGLF